MCSRTLRYGPLLRTHVHAGLGGPVMEISFFRGKIFMGNKAMCLGVLGWLMAPTNHSDSSCLVAALVTPHSSEDITCR